jgi:hypothetical protein
MQARPIVTEPFTSLSTNQRGSENLSRLDIVLAVVISLAMLMAIAIPIYVYIFKGLQYSLSREPRTKFSCNQCQYVSNNNYLRCALHPSTVFTEQAANCKDYDPTIQVKQVGKLRNILQKIRNIFPD